jgi:serine/threonine protein phosphatase PrpC
MEEFLVIACDGIWDVMSNDDICAYIRDHMKNGESDMGLIAEEILDNCLRLGR